MSDHNERAYPFETRLAILEETMRRAETRLNQVSERVHTLVNTVTQTAMLADEARDQRLSLIAKVERVENTIDTLDTAMVRNGMNVEHHVEICAARAARLEKIAWAMLSGVAAILCFLVLQYLSHLVMK